MSVRAEIVRLCLPWFMRPRFPPDVQIEDVRRRMTRFVHLTYHHAPLDPQPISPALARRRLSVWLSGAVSRFYLASPVQGPRYCRPPVPKMQERARAGSGEWAPEVESLSET
jgi:hypothetical protein